MYIPNVYPLFSLKRLSRVVEKVVRSKDLSLDTEVLIHMVTLSRKILRPIIEREPFFFSFSINRG